MSLWVKLLESQKKIKHAVKDAKNPHLKNHYASLNSVIDEVKPILNDNGIVLTQHIKNGPPGFVKVVTKLTEATSGDSTCDDVCVPVKHKFSKDGVDLGPDAQELGSAITYGRRYGLLAMCAIASEDDDGETATVGVVRQPAPVAASSGAPATPAAKPISDDQKRELGNKLGSALGWTPKNA